MRLYDVISGGGIWWVLDDPRSPGHDIALPSGTLFKVRTGGTSSQTFVSGHIEKGLWFIDEGQHTGDYPTADATVRAVHNGTSLNAWLYVVILHNGAWCDANDVRCLPGTQIDTKQTVRLKWCVRQVQKHPKAKEASAARILIAAAKMAAEMDDEEISQYPTCAN